MAGAIRGITVEIGGDTTKLGKALEGTEKKSRSLQVELRQIEKLLKFDPTNTDLLAQKQDVLKNAIAETAQKLDILKEAEAQVIAQFERGEIAEDQLRAFQREILKTENSLDDMKTELSATETAMKKLADGTDSAEKHTDEYKESVEKAKQELSDFKDKASEAFDTLKTGATVLGGAVLATGGYALKLSTDFDQAFNTLITRTGASTEEMDSLNEAMENVYANNFGESIEDVAESMATVKTNTKLSGDELQKATERALLLRDTFEFDVNESTRSAKMLMDQYGMSAEEAYNLIAQGAQNGLDKNGDLLDTINEYSVHFEGLGLSAEDMFNMLVNGAENGTFSVDKLGDAVKEFGIRVKDGTAENAFKELGFDVEETTLKFAQGGEGAKQALQEVTTALFNMEDPVKQNQLGVELFGTMWEDLGVEGVKALMNLDGSISTTSDSLNKINEQKYDDIGSALQGLGRTLETDVVKPLGEELKPVVEEAIEYVKANGPQITEVLSNIVSAIGDFVGFIVDNSEAILATIVGIGTGLLVWNVASMITGVVNAIKAFKLANEGATIAQALFNAVLNANPIVLLVTVIAAVVAAIVTFIATNEDARAKFVEIWNAIKKFASTVWNGIKNVASTVWNAIKNTVINIWNGIKTGISTAINTIKTVISTVFNAIKTAITTYVNAWKTVITTVWNAIKSTISSVVNGIKSVISTVFNSIKSVVSTVVNGIKSTISSVWNNIKSTTTSVFNGIKSAMGNALNSAKSTVVNACKNIFTGMKNAFSNIGSTFKSIGSSVIEGIKNGITGAVSGLYNAIKNALSGLVDKAKKALGINSPSKVFANVVGKAIPEGVAKGIDDNVDLADEAVQDMTDDLTDQAANLNGATINRKLTTTFNTRSANAANALNAANLMSMLQNILDKLGSLQVVLDSGELVGGIIDPIDNALSDKYNKAARGW